LWEYEMVPSCQDICNWIRTTKTSDHGKKSKILTNPKFVRQSQCVTALCHIEILAISKYRLFNKLIVWQAIYKLPDSSIRMKFVHHLPSVNE
jgi:hypothetical protein